MAAKKRAAKKKPVAKNKPVKKKPAGKKKPATKRMTTAERFVTGQYSKADLEPVDVKCPECGNKGFEPMKGRFGPVWRCTNRPACKHFFDSKPTGKRCRYEKKGKKCGALMVEGTKTIPDRCSDKACPNRNPHKL